MTEQQEPSTTTRYTPSEFEDSIYQIWQDSGLFTPPADGLRPTFTVMIPPPNVTGVLHMGHALNNTLQDVVIRHRRMTGYDALWVPGTDHAGIATQAVVEKKLYREQDLKRSDMGRDAFVDEIWKWREHHGDVILNQLQKLGASCDWSRTKFTLDPGMSLAVRTAFVKMWEKKLVYRGSRLVNWDCNLETAVSDDEIEYVTRKGKIYTLRYPLADSDEYIDVATTRPETMLGDMGVAVHPDDKRYAHMVGKNIALPLTHRLIPIVADDSVEADYGTGAVKITPGHDPADYERGQRHNMQVMNILNGDGTMNEECGQFAGLPREKAREEVVAAFEKLELFVGVEDITHNVTISDRSKSVIEPLVSEQWFVRMSEMSQPAINAVNDGSLNFKPARWKNVYLDWLENVHDWCISRQLWWGHRIPVWYDEDNTPLASIEDVEIGSLHPETGKPIVRQDEDVLDTWASSWLWPFATLGWPDSETSQDLTRFYPTQFLSTGRD
ncbi:MAG TPA: valine--tRNA ligase, partial [Planctomycetes bacterium]|nr:valine--tRNA ligase [Planctomycetota bacterium]